MDIHAGVIAAVILIVLGAFMSVRAGVRTIRSAQKLPFFRLRRQRAARGWRFFGLAILMIILAAWLARNGEPIAYQYFPPTPTLTGTPTSTLLPTNPLTPTITVTGTITTIPAINETPTITSTPFLPPAIEALFISTITPNPAAAISPLQFSTVMKNLQAVGPSNYFRNPIKHMYATFNYDKMVPGAQWTALWYRDGELVHHETIPWDGYTGGYGFADWEPPQEQWRPGSYEVLIFVGTDWKRTGRFILQGEPPTATLTRTPTPTVTLTPTRTPTSTPTLSPTPTPSPMPSTSSTSRPPNTAVPTPTR